MEKKILQMQNKNCHWLYMGKVLSFELLMAILEINFAGCIKMAKDFPMSNDKFNICKFVIFLP